MAYLLIWGELAQLAGLVWLMPHFSKYFRCVYGLSLIYSPLWGCAEDRVEMVIKVHCGTVLEDAFSTWRQIRPPEQSHNALWQPSRPGLPRNLKVANKSRLSRFATLKTRRKLGRGSFRKDFWIVTGDALFSYWLISLPCPHNSPKSRCES